MDAELEARISKLEKTVGSTEDIVFDLIRRIYQPSQVEVSEFRILDPNGKPVILLGSDGSGGTITLLHRDKPRIKLSATHKGGTVQVLNRDGASVVGLSSDSFGGLCGVSDSVGRPMVELGVDGFGGVLQTLNHDCECVGTIRADSDGGLLEARSNAGEVVTLLGVTDHGGMLQVRDHEGIPMVFMAAVDSGGRLSISNGFGNSIIGLEASINGGRIELCDPLWGHGNALTLSESGGFRLEGATEVERQPEKTLRHKRSTSTPEELEVHDSESTKKADEPNPTEPNAETEPEFPVQAIVEPADWVRKAADIVRVIAAAVDLVPLQSGFVGACPFHVDTGQSMNVLPEKQIYFCPDCGACGDALAFVKDFHKLTGDEAKAVLFIRGRE